MRRRWMRAGVTVAAVTGMLLVAQGAYASTPLADATTVTGTVNTTYAFSTTTNYWSVIGVATSADYDLSLYNSRNILLASSTYGTGLTDFIAINSNQRVLQSYTATVTHFAGSGSFYAEQRQGHTITTLPVSANDGVSGPGDPDLAFAAVDSQDVLSVSDIYLTAGQKFWVNDSTVGQTFFLLESDPNDISTTIRTRSQATAIPNTRTAQGCTLYTANFTGWHGLVELSYNLPHATSPQEGTANALVAYDPARPNTCPERNFPDSTPPGP